MIKKENKKNMVAVADCKVMLYENQLKKVKKDYADLPISATLKERQNLTAKIRYFRKKLELAEINRCKLDL